MTTTQTEWDKVKIRSRIKRINEMVAFHRQRMIEWPSIDGNAQRMAEIGKLNDELAGLQTLLKRKENASTTGPWGFHAVNECNGDPCEWEIHGPCGGVIASTNSGTNNANARLISAAPELLAALKGLLEVTEENYDNRHEVEAALHAIAKAEGRGEP